MSTYTSTDMDIVVEDSSGNENRSQRTQKATLKGKTYNAQRKHRTCINVQTKITKQINKIDLATSSHENCHVVRYELDILVALNAELQEAYQLWHTELRT